MWCSSWLSSAGVAGIIGAAGKLVARAYREEFKEEPPRRQQFVDGAPRQVKSYRRSWLIDNLRDRDDDHQDGIDYRREAEAEERLQDLIGHTQERGEDRRTHAPRFVEFVTPAID